MTCHVWHSVTFEWMGWLMNNNHVTYIIHHTFIHITIQNNPFDTYAVFRSLIIAELAVNASDQNSESDPVPQYWVIWDHFALILIFFSRLVFYVWTFFAKWKTYGVVYNHSHLDWREKDSRGKRYCERYPHRYRWSREWLLDFSRLQWLSWRHVTSGSGP